MSGLGRRIEVVDHDFPLGRIVQAALDAVVARDAPALGDVERALAERHAVGRLHALEDLLHLALAAAIDDGINVGEIAVADEHGAVVAEGERARLG